MWLRRAFSYIQFAAAIVLPLWLLIGRGLIVDGPGWEFVLLLFVCPILAVAMLIVAGLTVSRRAVRRDRAVSWLDVGIHTGWYLSIIGAGIVANEVLAVLIVVFAVAAFWLALWQLFAETRDRVKSALAGLDYSAVPAGEYQSSRPNPDAPGAGRVIRIDPPSSP